MHKNCPAYTRQGGRTKRCTKIRCAKIVPIQGHMKIWNTNILEVVRCEGIYPVSCPMEERLTGQCGSVVEVEADVKETNL